MPVQDWRYRHVSEIIFNTNLRCLHSKYLHLNSSAKLNCQKSNSPRFTYTHTG